MSNTEYKIKDYQVDVIADSLKLVAEILEEVTCDLNRAWFAVDLTQEAPSGDKVCDIVRRNASRVAFANDIVHQMQSTMGMEVYEPNKFLKIHEKPDGNLNEEVQD